MLKILLLLLSSILKTVVLHGNSDHFFFKIHWYKFQKNIIYLK